MQGTRRRHGEEPGSMEVGARTRVTTGGRRELRVREEKEKKRKGKGKGKGAGTQKKEKGPGREVEGLDRENAKREEGGCKV